MVPLLLDTCALIWWMADAPELGRAARRAISNPKNTVFVSVASIWEVAIKVRRRRLSGADEYLARHREFHDEWGFSTVMIEASDAISAGGMTIPHADPFDRMLIAQAHRLEARIVTCDAAIRSHVRSTLW